MSSPHHSGVMACRLVRGALLEVPSLAPLAVVLKAFLQVKARPAAPTLRAWLTRLASRQRPRPPPASHAPGEQARGLNDSFQGGVSSYATVTLLCNFLRSRPGGDLGDLLVGFLRAVVDDYDIRRLDFVVDPLTPGAAITPPPPRRGAQVASTDQGRAVRQLAAPLKTCCTPPIA